MSTYSREYYQRNKEKIKAARKVYYVANREAVLTRTAAYDAAFKEKNGFCIRTAYQHRYPGIKRAADMRAYWRNPEKAREDSKQYDKRFAEEHGMSYKTFCRYYGGINEARDMQESLNNVVDAPERNF